MQNAAIISVNFFSAKFYISLALIIFVSSIIGAIVATLFGLQKEFKLSRGNKLLTKKTDDIEIKFENYQKENSSLKIENETFKIKIEALQTLIEALEIKNKHLDDAMDKKDENTEK